MIEISDEVFQAVFERVKTQEDFIDVATAHIVLENPRLGEFLTGLISDIAEPASGLVHIVAILYMLFKRQIELDMEKPVEPNWQHVDEHCPICKVAYIIRDPATGKVRCDSYTCDFEGVMDVRIEPE